MDCATSQILLRCCIYKMHDVCSYLWLEYSRNRQCKTCVGSQEQIISPQKSYSRVCAFAWTCVLIGSFRFHDVDFDVSVIAQVGDSLTHVHVLPWRSTTWFSNIRVVVNANFIKQNKWRNQHLGGTWWDSEKGDLLIRKILTQKPWEYRSKSTEGGAVWIRIAQVLNLLDGFNVSQRSIRDRYKNSLKKTKKQIKAAEERASGIAPK